MDDPAEPALGRKYEKLFHLSTLRVRVFLLQYDTRRGIPVEGWEPKHQVTWVHFLFLAARTTLRVTTGIVSCRAAPDYVPQPILMNVWLGLRASLEVAGVVEQFLPFTEPRFLSPRAQRMRVTPGL